MNTWIENQSKIFQGWRLIASKCEPNCTILGFVQSHIPTISHKVKSQKYLYHRPSPPEIGHRNEKTSVSGRQTRL